MNMYRLFVCNTGVEEVASASVSRIPEQKQRQKDPSLDGSGSMRATEHPQQVSMIQEKKGWVLAQCLTEKQMERMLCSNAIALDRLSMDA